MSSDPEAPTEEYLMEHAQRQVESALEDLEEACECYGCVTMRHKCVQELYDMPLAKDKEAE